MPPRFRHASISSLPLSSFSAFSRCLASMLLSPYFMPFFAMPPPPTPPFDYFSLFSACPYRFAATLPRNAASADFACHIAAAMPPSRHASARPPLSRRLRFSRRVCAAAALFRWRRCRAAAQRACAAAASCQRRYAQFCRQRHRPPLISAAAALIRRQPATPSSLWRSAPA